MADKPMPFSAPMVRALIAGRKTRTRRILNAIPSSDLSVQWRDTPLHGFYRTDRFGQYDHIPVRIPYVVGDRLYVRESYYQQGYWKPTPPKPPGTTDKEKWSFVPEGEPTFEAPAKFRNARWGTDPWTIAWHKRLGRFMPRAYSRLTLLVTDVHIERLQDISEADAIAEGTPCYVCGGPLDGSGEADCHCYHRKAMPIDYANLWNSINGPGAWDANPWVVAISFTVHHHNIDIEKAD